MDSIQKQTDGMSTDPAYKETPTKTSENLAIQEASLQPNTSLSCLSWRGWALST